MITARIYISGRMSGLDREQCLARFRLAEEKLRSLGYCNIVNPCRVWAYRWPWLWRLMNRLLGEQRAYALVLLYDLWLLTVRCQRIYKIPGWQQSRGANIESATAYNFNLFLINKPDRAVIDRHLEELIKQQERDAAGRDNDAS